jgi:hypothetical protein
MPEPKRFEFVIEGVPYNRHYVATLGDYDEGSPIGTGDTPSEAIIDWLELHGETIDE